MIENPKGGPLDRLPGDDVLSDVLKKVRLSGSLQFVLVANGDWQTEGRAGMASLARGAAAVIPFHILVEGDCWLRMDGQQWPLATGDVVAFPFASEHQLGVGTNGMPVSPIDDLPAKPWREIPVLEYGEGSTRMRLLCGYLQCDTAGLRSLRTAMPRLIYVSTAEGDGAAWLRATIAQIVAEVDRPRSGGLSLLERLTEIMLIELLRLQIATAAPGATGWLAALADPGLSRCLSRIHDDPAREWTVGELATAAGLSRSTLNDRFEAVLGTSPMRYVRDWRLHLAGVALATTDRTIATIADESGYGTEAAFSRAFSRAYGVPPATWRHRRMATR